MTETAKEDASVPVGMMKWVWLSGLTIVLDQLTKWMVSHNLQLGEVIPVFPTFNLTRVYNPGAAWSFLANAGGWQRWFFTAIGVTVCAVLVAWLRRVPKSDWWLAAAIALILGGAVGNLIDRVWMGHVTDFLQFYWPPSGMGNVSYFPSFNVADSGITVGAFMMILDMIRNPKK